MMMKTTILPTLLLSVTCAVLLPACSTSPMGSSDGTMPNAQTLFASTAELDYTAKAEEYRIGVADLLETSVFRAEEFSRQARVDSDGNISLPLLGNIKVEGLTPVQTEQVIAERLRQKYLQNPQVTVFVKEYSSQHITLDGSFKTPGVYPITAGQVNLIQALALGNGLDDMADPSKIVLFRKVGNQVKAYQLNIDTIRKGQSKNPYLRNNDIIVAHRSDSRYWLKEVSSSMSNIANILSPF
ncbi:polysaccharide biosynthesis/export family protein [Thiothrix fructosivorans]|uniref:Polysaccharide export protein n=1 Tax=Thiothrix fructosivorans TaxID=111770 RepID=A0A8B0SEL7_9GAMM|nr:polysaccharide biosynthesis/export family protein [Thiothrix fructosivorans]MBO0614344.1 polysaccharide export protein [Thiothrix fructosivorans]QTX09189.1 polysaccharide export protein [Thiothrix fructosivorans]